MPLAPMFGQYLDMVDERRPMTQVEADEANGYRRKARAEYHEAATKLAHDMGYRAYWADLYGGRKNTCLVVLDPEAVTITDQDAACSMDKTPR